MTTLLHQRRLAAVVDVLLHSGARRVIDLGCGRGDLLQRLLAFRQFERIVGIDTCAESVAAAQREIPRDETESGRILMMYGSFTEGDPSHVQFDAAVMLETIEHVDPRHLSKVERFLFHQMKPKLAVITTPNSEYNGLLRMEADQYRHAEHRFEWTRPKFEAWCKGVAGRNDYSVEFDAIGDADPIAGGPSQMAVFRVSPRACRARQSARARMGNGVEA